MDMMIENETRDRLKEVFSNNGIEIFEGEEDFQLEMDSLRFITVVVSIEDAFSVEVPEQYLSNEILSSFRDFFDMLVSLISE